MRMVVHAETLWLARPGHWQTTPLAGARVVKRGDIVQIPLRRARRDGLLSGAVVPLRDEPCEMCASEAPEAPGMTI